MPSKKTPAEQLRAGRSPGRDSGGRVVGAQASTIGCPHAARKLARANRILDDESMAIYEEAIFRIEVQTPHYDGGYHGVPEDWEDIAIVENAINGVVPPELQLRASALYDLIERSAPGE
ncbi:MAG TPA: hypothetical protein VKS82_09555 [Streptosporangiaceae bacterium]|nr:hypothetical protein [Streptosporangiaceae bacterium]